MSFPDSQRKDMKAAARGDIPVLLIQSNMVKDDLDGRLDCLEPGKGMFRYPDWLSDTWFAELCVESRTDKGWENLSGHRNEAWDLAYYAVALCISQLIRAEDLNWNEPPPWAAEWDTNNLVRLPEKDRPFVNQLKSSYDFASFAKALA